MAGSFETKFPLFIIIISTSLLKSSFGVLSTLCTTKRKHPNTCRYMQPTPQLSYRKRLTSNAPVGIALNNPQPLRADSYGALAIPGGILSRRSRRTISGLSAAVQEGDGEGKENPTPAGIVVGLLLQSEPRHGNGGN